MWRRRLNRARRHQGNWDNVGAICGCRGCLDGLSIVKWIAYGLPTRGAARRGGERTLRPRIEVNDAISRGGVHSDGIRRGGCSQRGEGRLTLFYGIGTIKDRFSRSRNVLFGFVGCIAGQTCTLTTAVQEEDEQGAYEDKENCDYRASEGTGTDVAFATAAV